MQIAGFAGGERPVARLRAAVCQPLKVFDERRRDLP